MRNLGLSSMIVLFAACRSNIDVATKSTPAGATDPGTSAETSNEVAPAPAPETPATGGGEPVPIDSAFSSAQRYFQTRSTVTLRLDVPGDDLTLINDTTGATLVEHATEGTLLRLYPAVVRDADRLAYGTNKLRVLVNDEAAPRFTQATLILRDFPLFGVQTGAFVDNVQRSAGFEGDAGMLASPRVTNGVGILSTGLIPTVSQ